VLCRNVLLIIWAGGNKIVLEMKHVIVYSILMVVLTGCGFYYSFQRTRKAPKWWANREITLCHVYEVVVPPTGVKYSFHYAGKEYKDIVGMAWSYLMPETGIYEVAFDPSNPKENVILFHKPVFFDDEEFVYTTGTTHFIVSKSSLLFHSEKTENNENTFLFNITLKHENGSILPKRAPLLQIVPYSDSLVSRYENKKNYIVMYSKKEWARCWMFLDYPVDGLSEAEIQAKIEELKQNNYMLRKRK
jgi:hypothetical protein